MATFNVDVQTPVHSKYHFEFFALISLSSSLVLLFHYYWTSPSPFPSSLLSIILILLRLMLFPPLISFLYLCPLPNSAETPATLTFQPDHQGIR